LLGKNNEFLSIFWFYFVAAVSFKSGFLIYMII
jgi:hypothetical protein